MIHIRGAKGRKDKYTILSDVVMEKLDIYIETYRPEKWLFYGRDKNTHLSTRSVQKIFENVVKKEESKKI